MFFKPKGKIYKATLRPILTNRFDCCGTKAVNEKKMHAAKMEKRRKRKTCVSTSPSGIRG